MECCCRGMVEPFFEHKNIESQRPSFQKTVDECLENMIKGGCKEPVDLVEKFALPVPTQVSSQQHMLHWGAAMHGCQKNAATLNGSGKL